jgi:hypothetical protein
MWYASFKTQSLCWLVTRNRDTEADTVLMGNTRSCNATRKRRLFCFPSSSNGLRLFRFRVRTILRYEARIARSSDGLWTGWSRFVSVKVNSMMCCSNHRNCWPNFSRLYRWNLSVVPWRRLPVMSRKHEYWVQENVISTGWSFNEYKICSGEWPQSGFWWSRYLELFLYTFLLWIIWPLRSPDFSPSGIWRIMHTEKSLNVDVQEE